MEPGQALILGLVVVLVVLLIAAYLWYHKTGWEDFTFAGTVPYAVGSKCNANPPPGSMLCPAGKTCCTTPGQQCLGSQCVTPCTIGTDCAPGQSCAGGICQTGTVPSWTASGNNDISSLRFKGCTFTVTDPSGKQHSADVTAVLNGMTVAYRGATISIPRTLYLDRPLNAFSFVIKGVNDSATITSPTEASAWMNSATSLTGQSRTI